MTRHLLVFGPGYTAQFIMKRALEAGWVVSATYRNNDKKRLLEAAGYATVPFEAGDLTWEDQPVTDILCSVAPPKDTEPTLTLWQDWLQENKSLRTLHYFSSTNVYGNHDGCWVDETTPPTPSLDRGKRRLRAENSWSALSARMAVPLFIYRLAGIYGPGRNAFRSLKAGKARRIIRPGQVFGRIHLDDICEAFWKAAHSGHSGGIFNLADDKPCPPQELIEAAALMLGMEPPAEQAFETAELSPMARSFYLENKRVKNDKVKTELGLKFKYPSYHEGLAALLPDEIRAAQENTD